MVVFASFFLAHSSVTRILFGERSKDFAEPRLPSLGATAHLLKEGIYVQANKYDSERPNKYKKISGAKRRVSETLPLA